MASREGSPCRQDTGDRYAGSRYMPVSVSDAHHPQVRAECTDADV